MNEHYLIRIGFAVSLVGIALLFFVAPEDTIEPFDSDRESTQRVQGIVDKVQSKNGITTISLRREEIVTLVVFDPIELSKGSKITATGTLETYRNKKQMVVNTIQGSEQE